MGVTDLRSAVVVAAAAVVGGDGLARGTGMDKVSFVGGKRSDSCIVTKGCVGSAGGHEMM